MTEAPFVMVMGMGHFTFVYCCVQFHIIRGKVTVYQGTTVFVKIYNSSEAWHQSVRPVCPFLESDVHPGRYVCCTLPNSGAHSKIEKVGLVAPLNRSRCLVSLTLSSVLYQIRLNMLYGHYTTYMTLPRTF